LGAPEIRGDKARAAALSLFREFSQGKHLLFTTPAAQNSIKVNEPLSLFGARFFLPSPPALFAKRQLIKQITHKQGRAREYKLWAAATKTTRK
jgi:hypothetical protein